MPGDECPKGRRELGDRRKRRSNCDRPGVLEKRLSRAIRTAAARAKELVMTGLGIQALVLPLIGIWSALAHGGFTEMLEILRMLGNSYRFASSEAGSSAVYGRFTFDFCRAIAAAMVGSLASRRSSCSRRRPIVRNEVLLCGAEFARSLAGHGFGPVTDRVTGTKVKRPDGHPGFRSTSIE
jgi:hypothetical protein